MSICLWKSSFTSWKLCIFRRKNRITLCPLENASYVELTNITMVGPSWIFSVIGPHGKSTGVGESLFGNVTQNGRVDWKSLEMANWYNKTTLISGELEVKFWPESRSKERDQESFQVLVGKMGAVNAESAKRSPFTWDLAHSVGQCPTFKRIEWGVTVLKVKGYNVHHVPSTVSEPNIRSTDVPFSPF